MGELLIISPVLQALLSSLLMWGLTAAGAALVFLTRQAKDRSLDAMLAFGAGVMLAASFWSLLSPAIDLAERLGQPSALLTAAGFICGGLLLIAADRWLSRRMPDSLAANSSRKRAALLISSITLHNIPEGLAVGVSFGALAVSPSPQALGAAWMLAIGIGLQNFPEGAAVSLPLRREGMSRGKAFFFGQASALVEPAAAVAGALLSCYVQPLLPFALAFAAGAMVCVVISDLVPESQKGPRTGCTTLFSLLGFAVMMILDVALG